MTILCADDHPVIVKGLKNSVKRIYPEAVILAFTAAKYTSSHAQSYGRDVLIGEKELYSHRRITPVEHIRIQRCADFQ